MTQILEGTEEQAHIPSVFCRIVWAFTKATSPFSTRHLERSRCGGERRQEVRLTHVIQRHRIDPSWPPATPACVRTQLSNMQNKGNKRLPVAMQFHKLSFTYYIILFFILCGWGKGICAHSCGLRVHVHVCTYMQKPESNIEHLPRSICFETWSLNEPAAPQFG